MSASSSSMSLSSSALLVATGAAIGTLITLSIVRKSPARDQAQDRRRMLPQTIILVRHGESEANADKSVWKRIPDNLLGLTDEGKEQAVEAGKRIETILDYDNCQRVHLVLSPFERALQTALCLRRAFEHRIVRTDIESRIREQEMGNIQGDEFSQYRRDQKRIGRFWFRFPTGESGADVCDRVKTWWFESVLPVNLRVGYEPIDAMVVVTHGLTMRFILMQLFGWSPTTFHSVWNAGNCDMYVLRKDLAKPGTSPYILDQDCGDMPRSSIDLMVDFRSTGESKSLRLENYLSIPPPRTTRHELIKRMLAKQYPMEVADADDIASIVFMPFVEGPIIKGRSTSGVASNHPSIVASNHHRPRSLSSSLEMDNRLCPVLSATSLASLQPTGDRPSFTRRVTRFAQQEMSLRYPGVSMSGSFPSASPAETPKGSEETY